MDDQEQQRFADQLAETLRAEEHEATPDVVSRLTEARRAAVAALEPRVRPRLLNSRQAFAGAAAAAVLTLAVIVAAPRPGGLPPLPTATQGELAAAQDAELLEELEFVAWVAALEVDGAQPFAD